MHLRAGSRVTIGLRMAVEMHAIGGQVGPRWWSMREMVRSAVPWGIGRDHGLLRPAPHGDPR